MGYLESKLSALKKKWKLLLNFVMIFFIVAIPSSSSNSTTIRWVDYTNVKPPEFEVFFDRIVAIVLNGSRDDNTMNNRTVIAPGVLFDDSFVLTSFNPYRKYLHNITDHNITIDVLHTRYMNNGSVSGYRLEKYGIECTGQVNPEKSNDTKLANEDIHDRESPLHDLMVIRIQGKVTFVNANESRNDKYKNKENNSFRAGPLKTILASKSDKLGRPIKFASFGYRTESEIIAYNRLHHTVYKKSDKASANCKNWMPDQWGHFICVKNIHEFEGIGSGAMLFFENKLFGIGTFYMGRKDDSVLVFTDVRPYYKLIYQTCKENNNQLLGNSA